MDQHAVEEFFRSSKKLLLRHRHGLAENIREFTSTLQVKLVDCRKADLFLAQDFNVFNFIQPNENRISDIFAWLLDPGGTHAQGETFLRHFVAMLDIPINYPLGAAQVFREE